MRALALAADRLGTLALLEPGDWDQELVGEDNRVALRLAAADFDAWFDPATGSGQALPGDAIFLELEDEPGVAARWESAASRWPETVISVHLALGPDAAPEAEALACAGVGVIHLYVDEEGQDAAGRPLPDALREVRLHLVEQALREQMTLFSHNLAHARPTWPTDRGDGHAAHRRPGLPA